MNEIAGTLEQMEADEMGEQEHRREVPGQGLAEYALILALIAIVTIAALILLGGQIQDALNDIGNSILPQ
jgi:pilus assembly protein Flp/PilA